MRGAIKLNLMGQALIQNCAVGLITKILNQEEACISIFAKNCGRRQAQAAQIGGHIAKRRLAFDFAFRRLHQNRTIVV